MSSSPPDSVPYVVVRDGIITSFSAHVGDELGCDPRPLVGPLDRIGTRLDDADFDDLRAGRSALRVRLGRDLADRPVLLRRLGAEGGQTWIEVRSLAHEFRLEALLRRSGMGHMLIGPDSRVRWSLSSDELRELMPGDDPIQWVDLMDRDDMRAILHAVEDVARNPDQRRTVSHRLADDDEHVVVDTIESALFDPDLRAVLMRSRLERRSTDDAPPDVRGPQPAWGAVSVSDHMPIGVVVASREGRVLHRNAVAAELIGVKIGQRIVPDGDGPWLLSRLDPEQAASFVELVRAAQAGTSGRCTARSPDEPDRWLRMFISPAAAATLVMTIEDATELVEAERALRASNRLLEALDANSEDLVMVFDSLGVSRYTSSSIERHLGLAAGVEHVEQLLPYVHRPDRSTVGDLVRRVRSMAASSEQVEFRVDVVGDGAARWYQATMTNLLDDPDVQGVVVTLRDIHERHLAERDLRFRATHDPLTTLPDRAALRTRLDAMLTEAASDGERVALMFCDIDHFKSINDRAGHHVGDMVLTEVATRLQSALRSSDVVGRFGGDEFVVLVPEVDDEAHAASVADRIFETVSGPARFEGVEIDIGVSVGVAVSDADGGTASELLRRADLAMYDAKSRGRGRVSLFVPADGGVGTERDALRADLRGAIARRELIVHYQPIVPLRDELGHGLEALLRWQHTEFGVIDAHRFIGLADGMGLTDDLTLALVDGIGRDVGTWAGGSDEFVCINLSPSQIGRADAVRGVLDRLAAARLSPERVVVEVGEAAFAHDPDARANVGMLRDAGARVFLDDFGAGRSSLVHLHRAPVDGLKIDPGILTPTIDARLVQLIVTVAGALGVLTVAKGVETDEQLAAVTRLGVDYSQGHLLGRPARTPERGGPHDRGGSDDEQR